MRKRKKERNLSSLSVPAKSKSFGTGHVKNNSDRPSYLSTQKFKQNLENNLEMRKKDPNVKAFFTLFSKSL